MSYRKHEIIRRKDLDNDHFEVVFNRKSLNFTPGDAVTLYKGDGAPLFIASAITEPWIRVILHRDQSPNFGTGVRSIRLNNEVQTLIPSLMSEPSPNFLISASGVGAFFSYVSCYPHKHCKVCYLGDNKVSEEWISAYHEVVSEKEIDKADNVYVIGDRDLLQGVVSKPDVTCYV
jgi:hypothetical protein